MSSPDQPTTPSSTGIPTPPSGVGASDLATDSTDPQVLRELLDRARERLAFYESFDRIIGENIRRSGELMVETVALREQAQLLAARSAKERAEFATTRQAERDHYRALIEQALSEVAAVRPVIDTLATRFERVLEELGEDAGTELSAADAPSDGQTFSDADSPAPARSVPDEEIEADSTAPGDEQAAAPENDEEPAQDAGTGTVEISATGEATQPEVAPILEAQATEGPLQIDLLAHGVPNARVAISLQNMLRKLEVVTGVQTREFANGELRLAIQATGVLPETTLTSWLAENNGELARNSSSVAEVTFRST